MDKPQFLWNWAIQALTAIAFDALKEPRCDHFGCRIFESFPVIEKSVTAQGRCHERLRSSRVSDNVYIFGSYWRGFVKFVLGEFVIRTREVRPIEAGLRPVPVVNFLPGLILG